MDTNMVIQLVSSLGFPIVACGAMAWYVYHVTEQNRQQIAAMMESHRIEVQDLNNQHQDEMNKVTEAINNNTIALTKLCERLGE